MFTRINLLLRVGVRTLRQIRFEFRAPIVCLLVCLTGALGHGAEPEFQPRELEFFEKEIRPLLAKHCYGCHSVNAKRLEAGLLLDSRAGQLRGGDSGAAIVPGQADKSLLIRAVKYDKLEMPPKGKLMPETVEKLVRWIDMGAPWSKEAEPTAGTKRDSFDLAKRRSEFWVWQPVSDPKSPAVKNGSWPKNEIDRHILSGLEEQGLRPAEDADRTALLRRLNFDLIGLPPTPEEVLAFALDGGSESIEKAVDRLLDSPHFGERWGRHWLDLTRYAESRGHEFDNDTPNAHQYRDYVIRALNAEVPYDQFVREHIAGDLLVNPRLNPGQKFNESVLGTGFWFLGEWVHSPVDIRKDESDRFDNMIDVMSKTFLGVTLACARCHDHKFDAISTADYYSLSGFLQSSDYRQVRFESMEQNRHVAERLAEVDAKYQREIRELLERLDLRPPKPSMALSDKAIAVDYGNISQGQYLQDGFIFGRSPRREGVAYLEGESKPIIKIARFGAAVSDPIWSGLESITEGAVQNRSALAKLPKSGRTLRSPTFELKHGEVRCLVEGTGHIVACVDSHRLVAGPLHQQTVRAVKAGERWITLNLERYVGHRLHLEFVPASGDQLSVRLVTQGLDAAGVAELDRRLAASDKAYDDYARAAEAFLNGAGDQIEERVFADFESGTYDGWTVTGDAFGKIPQTLGTIGTYQGRINGVGTYFVNSHNIRGGGDVPKGDRLTGTLTSSEFIVDCDEIEFLVGGGNHEGKTCVNLLVDGQAVMTATGARNNQMSLKLWDVRPHAGRRARIQVVDNHTGGWGNIGMDHIVFKTRRVSDGSPARRIVQAWKKERDQIGGQIVRKSRVAPAMLDGSGEDDRVLIRGNSSNPGPVEPRHFLTAISGNAPMSIQSGSGRLELADRINDPANPLTSRVIVNRIWHHLMGRGIVPTTDDFGFLGQRPTHPELLDHLATRFIAEGQSIKAMIKYIVLSRTYQMSGHADDHAREVDPKNLLWHHQAPRRLQGEVIRDALLFLSGRFDPAPFGPPVPIHLTSFMDGRGRPKNSGPLDGAGRRSIYVAVRRNFLSPFMLTFDTPVPFSSMGRRNVSNVPAQSLILMNDPLVVELARGWAERALKSVSETGPDGTGQGVAWLYRTGFGREPTPRESRAATAFLNSKADALGAGTEDLGLWADLAHVLVNTKEFIFLR